MKFLENSECRDLYLASCIRECVEVKSAVLKDFVSQFCKMVTVMVEFECLREAIKLVLSTSLQDAARRFGEYDLYAEFERNDTFSVEKQKAIEEFNVFRNLRVIVY